MCQPSLRCAACSTRMSSELSSERWLRTENTLGQACLDPLAVSAPAFRGISAGQPGWGTGQQTCTSFHTMRTSTVVASLAAFFAGAVQAVTPAVTPQFEALFVGVLEIGDAGTINNTTFGSRLYAPITGYAGILQWKRTGPGTLIFNSQRQPHRSSVGTARGNRTRGLVGYGNYQPVRDFLP